MSNQKVIVITGASSGIGLSLGNQLTSKGHIVYSLSRQSKKSNLINFLSCDITSPKEVEKALALIQNLHQRIDVIVNNSGYGLGGNFESIKANEIFNQINLNLFGAINVNQQAFNYLVKSQGQIINIGSVVSELIIPYMTFYCASKAAILAYSKKIHCLWKEKKILVNIVLIGAVKSNFQKSKHVYFNETLTKNFGPKTLAMIEKNSFKFGAASEKIANKIAKIIEKRPQKCEQVIGLQTKIFIWFKKVIKNDGLVQLILYKKFKL